jgi:hypothetical protein
MWLSFKIHDHFGLDASYLNWRVCVLYRGLDLNPSLKYLKIWMKTILSAP